MANEVAKSDQRTFTVYGTGNASTDNSRVASIIAKANATGAKCTIRFDGRGSNNEVNITSLHTILVPANLECVGQTFVVRGYNSGIMYNNPIQPWNLSIKGTMAARTAGAYEIGTLSIDADLNPLDYVAIWADNNLTTTTPHNSSQPSRPMEVHRLERKVIAAGGAATNSWIIQDLLDDDFTTSPQVAKITTMLQGIRLKNFRMKVATGAYNGEGIGNGLTFNACDDVLLEDCVFGPYSPGAIGFDFCMNVRRVNCKFGYVENANTQLQFSTYGIVDSTCNRTETLRCKFGTLSHGMTTGGRDRTINQYALAITATGGTYTLTANGSPTSSLAFNASSSAIQAALVAVGAVGAGNATVTGSAGSYTITFTGAAASPATLTVATGSLTGGSATVTPTAITYRYGGPKLQVIDGNDFQGVGYQVTSTGNYAGLPQLDFHTEGRRAKVRNNTFTLQLVPGGSGVCLNARCRDLEVTDNTFHCGLGGYPWQIRGANQTYERNRVFGGLTIIQDSYGTQPNIDKLKIRGNLFVNMQGGCIKITTGTDVDIDENTFFMCSGTQVNSPFMPKALIYVASLTDSSSKIRVRKNTMPKGPNDFAFYASDLVPGQLEVYEGNVCTGYGGASIGIARKRVASDPSGAVDTLIDEAFEWEAEFGHLNGQQKLIYVKEAAHGLTAGDVDSPIISTHDVYDDTVAGSTIVGWLVDVASDDWYILAPPGATIEIPPGTIQGTYSTGSGRDLSWDASVSGGKLVVTKPGDSAADAPTFRVNYYSATLLQITLPIAGTGGGGTFEWAAIEW